LISTFSRQEKKNDLKPQKKSAVKNH